MSVLIKCAMYAFLDFYKLSVDKLLLDLSDKGVCASSSQKIATAICNEIRRLYNVTYGHPLAARDLGLTFTAGTSRPSALLLSRLKNNSDRIHKSVNISKVCRAGRKLFSGSGFAASTWGHSVCGFSVTAIESSERQAAKCTGVKPEGRCRFTCLVLGYGWKSHPKARIIRETFTIFYVLLQNIILA